MPKLNVASLTKQEIIWLSTHRCNAHSHSYLSHFSCYKKEVLDYKEERIGILDIEATGLDADFGFILSYAIKDASTGEVLGRVLSPEEVSDGRYDSRLCADLVRDMRKFDRIVGYYIKDRRFDIPFIRSRCLCNGVDFPKYGELKISDCYDIVKNKMKLGRSSLASACAFLGIAAKTHPLTGKKWMDARTGKKEGLDWVFKHNIEDVDSTIKLWSMIKDFVRKQKVSI
jgi:uncharacterized protein YprB with RNaseH-like and TPR domain